MRKRIKESQFKRSRLELYYYILRSCFSKENHTRGSLNRELLMSYSLIDECLNYLQQVGFIDINYNDRTIKTTLKGQDYVQKFGFLMQQIDEASNLPT